MKEIHTSETVDDVRKRLYDRGADLNEQVKHQLSDTKIDVSRSWNIPAPVSQKAKTTDLRQGMTYESDTSTTESALVVEPLPKRHGYRSFVLVSSLVILVVVALTSTVFLYYGGNQISGSNIEVAVEGPTSIGGGETVDFQIMVTNQNSVPIESVTLIVKYPDGTQSTGYPPRRLYEERIPVEDIAPGAVMNVPLKAVLFGGEAAEQQITATVEYRVQGSSGTFYRDAEPLAIKITSAPIVLQVDSIEKAASGQTIDVTITAISNASTPLKNVLITVSYPNGFSYTTADPEPVFGQNVWRIDELLPEQTQQIKLSGLVKGFAGESYRLGVTAGPAEDANPFIVRSTLAESFTDFVIEQPFIQVAITNGRETISEVAVSRGDEMHYFHRVTNTLEEAVYDMRVEVEMEGNALVEAKVVPTGGEYDPRTNTVRWNVEENESLERILPGETRNFEMKVLPGPQEKTASYDMTLNVFARRVSEPSAQESLIGSSKASIKFSAPITVASENRLQSGPVPPRAGEATIYTPTIVAMAGANDLTEATVELQFPGYVKWLDEEFASDELSFNPITRTLTWKVGDLTANAKRELVVPVEIMPSFAQVGTTPAIINTQYFKAKDRFSEGVLQVSAPAVTTELSTELGYQKGNGIVVQP